MPQLVPYILVRNDSTDKNFEINLFLILKEINSFPGYSKNAPAKDYSIKGSRENRVFGSFTAISIIATTYGNGIIPEIQVVYLSLLFCQVKIWRRNSTQKC